MKEVIPLIQTVAWIALILFLSKKMLPEMEFLKKVILKRLESGSSVKVGPVEIGELKEEVTSVKERLGEIDKKVANLFLTTMAPNMYLNLNKIGSGNFGAYSMSNGLERELYHLRDIGYVDVESIKSIPKQGDNLSSFVTITPTGSQFLKLRSSIESSNVDSEDR